MRAALSADEPAKAIRGFFAAQLAPLDADAPPGCLLAVSAAELGAREDALGEALRAAEAEARAVATAAFARWRDAGRVRADLDPEAAAALLLALERGTAALHRTSADSDAPETAARAGAEALLAWAGAELLRA